MNLLSYMMNVSVLIRFVHYDSFSMNAVLLLTIIICDSRYDELLSAAPVFPADHCGASPGTTGAPKNSSAARMSRSIKSEAKRATTIQHGIFVIVSCSVKWILVVATPGESFNQACEM